VVGGEKLAFVNTEPVKATTGEILKAAAVRKSTRKIEPREPDEFLHPPTTAVDNSEDEDFEEPLETPSKEAGTPKERQSKNSQKTANETDEPRPKSWKGRPRKSKPAEMVPNNKGSPILVSLSFFFFFG
jgi:hypothetical protein